MADLDPRQRAAVDAGPVDLFVTAGAGSGKTRVLSTRFVNAGLGRPPYAACKTDELVAVTYTDKAAGELSERIRAGLGSAGAAEAARSLADAWISTIHGMCSRILRRYALIAGVDPHFRVLDSIEASAMEAEALETVLGRMLVEDEGLTDVLDAYGADAVIEAARSMRAKTQALGLHAHDVVTVSAGDAEAELRAACGALAGLVPAFAGLRPTKRVLGNADAVRALLERLDFLASDPESGTEASLEACGACSLQRWSAEEGLNELVDACKEQIERIRRAAAQLLVTPFEQALVRFASALESAYQQLKRERGALDFEDLQVATAELLEGHPEVAERYRRQFAMLMLDEFQDTNELQLRIVRQISRDNLCTVGDENQSIYAFRHADVEVFRAMARAATNRAFLDANYRTDTRLLAVLNGLFSHPELLGTDFLRLQPPEPPAERRPWPDTGPRFTAMFVDSSTTNGSDSRAVEAHIIATRVQELISAGVAPRDIAVLMRAMSGGRSAKVEDALMERGIPVYTASGGSFFEQSEVIEARALLRTIANVRDDEALTTVLAGRLGRLSSEALLRLRSRADELAAERGVHRRDVHLWDAASAGSLSMDASDAAALARTVRAVEHARAQRGTRSLSHAVLEPLLELDMDLVLLSEGRRGMRGWSNLLKLARMAGEFESAGSGELGAFLDYLALRELHATSEQEATVEGEADAVRVMSIHSAKGLEFPAVIVGGLSAGQDGGPIFFARVGGRPTLGMTLRRQGERLATMGSERVGDAVRATAESEAVRLMYVACTRAEESLTVIGRTDRTKEAGRSIGERIRTALGFGAAESLHDGETVVGDGIAAVRLIEASLPAADETAARVPAGGVPEPFTMAEDSAPRSSASAGLPSRVSYTALATYRRCPRRFFLTSVAKLPAPPAARAGGALAFGSAVHDVLERCTSPAVDIGPWLGQAAVAAGLERAETKRLRAAVEAYLRSPIAAEVFGADSAMREASIAVALGSTVLGGAMDLIAWHGNDALIVDYKTGSAPLSEAQARDRYLLQAQCYSLAAFAAGAGGVRVVFAELERGRQTEFVFGQADAEANRADVLRIIEQVESGAFDPMDSYEAELCETCPGLGGLCPVTRPWRRDAAD